MKSNLHVCADTPLVNITVGRQKNEKNHLSEKNWSALILLAITTIKYDM